MTGNPNTFAPEGASRCRALTSGLRGRAAGRKERLSDEWRRLNLRTPEKSRKVSESGIFSNRADWRTPCRNRHFEANRAMTIARRRVSGRGFELLAGAAAVIGIPSVWMYRMKTYAGPVSDHFDGKHFFDPDGAPPKSLREVLRWQFGGGRQRQAWPEWAPSPHAETPPARVDRRQGAIFVCRPRQLADPDRQG